VEFPLPGPIGARAKAIAAVAIGLLMVALIAPAPRVWAGVEGARLSPDETRRLDAGELVQRPASRRQGSLSLMGGSSWQVIDAPVDAVWKALLDTAHYPRMMPQVIEARLVEELPGERTVYLRQGRAGLLEKSYYLHIKVHEDRRDITFTVDDRRPHDVRAAWGFYSLRPYGAQGSLLAYGVMADVGDGLMMGLLREQVHDWMLRTPWLVKRFVEGSGRKLYQ